MNYIDVYKRRISHLGSDYQEHAYKSGILEFRRYLKYNQHTEKNLILEGTDVKFDGVILTDKEDENRVSQILLTKVIEDGGPALKPGDLIQWGSNEGPWLIYRTTTSSYQPHQKFYMVRCNYKINWLDADGMLHDSWIYLLGSKDSKIKDNFRTWHSVITPQPNKYINIMMPHQLMNLGTEIMVLDEVWHLVDYDQNSVPGVIFMSFTETNFNEQRDSLEDKLANADRLATWEIQMLKNQVVEANSVVDLNYTILKNGVAQDVEPTIEVSENFTLLNPHQVQVGNSGSGTITINYKGIAKTQTLTVGKTPAAKIMLVGNDKIRVASENIYTVENAITPVIFNIEDPNGLVTANMKENTCIIKANEKNKLGSFILTVDHNGTKISKTIQVVSLWQVI